MKRERYIMPPEAVEAGVELGYTPSKIPLLFLVPLVQVGWAEGFLQAGERKMILQFAENFQMTGDEANFQQINVWLNERPSDDFFDESLEDLCELLDRVPVKQAAYLREVLRAGCVATARASGEIGLLRRERSSIHREELELLEKIGARLGLNIQALISPIA